jgi:hypothetical protein
MSIHDLKNALQFVIGQRESGEYPGPAVAWGCMCAKPVRVEDPDDPEVILRDLPVRERAEFLRQYREAVDVAHDPPGYGRLQRLLHVWRVTVIAIGRVGYYGELAAVRNGTAQTRPAEEAFPDWQQRLAAERIQAR